MQTIKMISTCIVFIVGFTVLLNAQIDTAYNYNRAPSPIHIHKKANQNETPAAPVQALPSPVKSRYAKPHFAYSSDPSKSASFRKQYNGFKTVNGKQQLQHASSSRPVLIQSQQQVIPVETALRTEAKENKILPQSEPRDTTMMVNFVIAVLAAMFGTGSILAYLFVQSKKQKQLQFNQRSVVSTLKKEQVISMPKNPIIIPEPRTQKQVIESVFHQQLHENDEERAARSEYELSRVLQEMRTKQRIQSVVTSKKQGKTKNSQIGNAKKIGTGLGEFELATRLAKLRARSSTKVTS